MPQSIQNPIGYKQLEALNKQTHRHALAKEPSFAFASTINALPLTVSEFPVACRHYPVVFVSPDGKGDDFAAAAVTGLKPGQNLFCDSDGNWRPQAYIPAYARCYPFCVATIVEDGKTRADKLVCMDAGAVVKDGLELFDEEGTPTKVWREREKLLQEYETDATKTAEMCRALKSMALLKEFAVQAASANKELFSLAGMYRVDETALAKLSVYQFRKLIEQGWMEKIYAHIISLRNFQALQDCA